MWAEADRESQPKMDYLLRPAGTKRKPKTKKKSTGKKEKAVSPKGRA